MILIPKTLYAQYLNFLKKNNIATDQYQEYVKWLRYFLDFCAKHVITPDKSERIRLFTEKLREKNQSDEQRQLAAKAISLYFELQGFDALAPSAADESKRQSSVEPVESDHPAHSTISQRQSGSNHTHSATPLPPICFRPVTTSELSRLCWGTPA